MIRYLLSFNPIPEPLIYMMVNGLHAIVVNVYDVHVYYTMFFGFEIYKNKKIKKAKESNDQEFIILLWSSLPGKSFSLAKLVSGF